MTRRRVGGVLVLLLPLVGLLGLPHALQAAVPPLGQPRGVCTVPVRGQDQQLSCPVLIVGRPVSVRITVYPQHSRRQPLRVIQVTNPSTVQTLVDLLDTLDYPPLGEGYNCTADTGTLDVLRFMYANKDRWTVRAQTFDCMTVTSHGVPARGSPRFVSLLRHLAGQTVTLGTRGVGPVPFGTLKGEAVRNLQKFLGPPNARGINTGCGAKYTEVTWKDFIAEFRLGRFSGYRYVAGGYPVLTKGSPRDHVAATGPDPMLSTAAGITLGSDLAELRQRYRKLRQSGADTWTAPSGLTFVVGLEYRDMGVGTDKIVEIKVGTCGAF
jgi:hypothetical protein